MNPYWLFWGAFALIVIPLTVSASIERNSLAPMVFPMVLGCVMYLGHRDAQRLRRQLAEVHARDRELDRAQVQEHPNSG